MPFIKTREEVEETMVGRIRRWRGDGEVVEVEAIKWRGNES